MVISTAGWSIPKKDAGAFPAEGTALERYASAFNGVEINSSFYSPHRRSTWERWSNSVPNDFSFAVKIPRTITHQRKLVDCSDPLERFCRDVDALGSKLAVLLVQLPPSLAFDPEIAARFFSLLSRMTAAGIVCEPRHVSWFSPHVDTLLDELGIARAAADPSVTDGAASPGGWLGLSYWRLHGSPIKYRSSYDDGRLASYAECLFHELAAGRTSWCTFDNTASSAAMSDALKLSRLLEGIDCNHRRSRSISER